MRVFAILLVLISNQVALAADMTLDECIQGLKWNKMRKEENSKFCQEFTAEHRACAKDLMQLKGNKLDYKKNIFICRTYSSAQIQCAKKRVQEGLGTFVNQFSYCLKEAPSSNPTPSSSAPLGKPSNGSGSGVQ